MRIEKLTGEGPATSAPRVIRRIVPLTVAALTLLFQFSCMDLGSAALTAERLGTGDSYTWHALIESLNRTGRWSPSVAAHNAPEGLATHLSLPYAALASGLARAAAPLVPEGTATRVAGRLSGPVLHAAAAAVLAWGAIAFLGPGGALASGVAFLVTLVASGLFHWQRFDHHALHLFLACLHMALLCRYAVHRRGGLAVAAGLVAGLGLWAGTEMLVHLGIGGLALGFHWAAFGGRWRARGLAGYALAMAAAITLALVVERPLADLAALDLDRLSGTYALIGAVLAAAACAAACAQERWSAIGAAQRLGIGAGAAGVAAAMLWAVIPDALLGPYGGVPPVVRDHWRTLIGEDGAAAVFAGMPATLGYFLGLAMLAAVPAAAGLRGPQRDAWALLAVGLVTAALATFLRLRLVIHFEVFASVALGGAAAVAGRFYWNRSLSILRAAAVPVAVAVVLSPYVGLLIGARFVDDAHPLVTRPWRDGGCDWMAVGNALRAQAGGAPGTIVSYAPPGPELAHFSGLGVVATGCHCNPDGMRDARAILLSPPDAAHRLAVRRRVAFVVQCPAIQGWQGHDWYLARSGPEGVYAKLARGEPPEWLVPVPLAGPALDAFIVHRTTFDASTGYGEATPATGTAGS